ncbi:MAG: hypothetical protein JWL92_617 [Candidatus Nomurabacteria bacterium]|nr:hypothetical protein [Candidatus Nomurabacteria bacterium]
MNIPDKERENDDDGIPSKEAIHEMNKKLEHEAHSHENQHPDHNGEGHNPIHHSQGGR